MSMNWKLILSMIAFMVSWKAIYRLEDGSYETVTEKKIVETRKEAETIAKNLPGWAWNVQIKEIREGRKP